ncbi:unnamed protein product [Ectocarpus fasciculatus]
MSSTWSTTTACSWCQENMCFFMGRRTCSRSPLPRGRPRPEEQPREDRARELGRPWACLRQQVCSRTWTSPGEREPEARPGAERVGVERTQPLTPVTMRSSSSFWTPRSPP